jgi:hypothetical protein
MSGTNAPAYFVAASLTTKKKSFKIPAVHFEISNFEISKIIPSLIESAEHSLKLLYSG